MSSFRKLQSARLNGAKSSGPKTPDGKAIVSMNALRHGLAAKTVVLSNESHDRFNGIHDAYIDEFDPRTTAELDAIEEMAIAKWRHRRYWGIEAATLDLQMDRQAKELEKEFTKMDEMTRLSIAFTALADNSNALRLLDRYLAGIRRDYDRAFHRLLDLRILNSPSDPPVAGSPTALSEPRASATGLPEVEKNALLLNEPNPTNEHKHG
jgi:hypothetical protein